MSKSTNRDKIASDDVVISEEHQVTLNALSERAKELASEIYQSGQSSSAEMYREALANTVAVAITNPSEIGVDVATVSIVTERKLECGNYKVTSTVFVSSDDSLNVSNVPAVTISGKDVSRNRVSAMNCFMSVLNSMGKTYQDANTFSITNDGIKKL